MPPAGSSANNAKRADFDRDGTVGFSDFLTFAAGFGLSTVDVGFDTNLDLDDDGLIDFADFLLYPGHYVAEPGIPVDFDHRDGHLWMTAPLSFEAAEAPAKR